MDACFFFVALMPPKFKFNVTQFTTAALNSDLGDIHDLMFVTFVDSL